MQHVSVPLRVRSAHWQQIQLFAFQHEPDGDRNCLPGFSADHGDLDLAVAVEAVFEVVLGTGHPVLHPIHGLRTLWVFQRRVLLATFFCGNRDQRFRLEESGYTMDTSPRGVSLNAGVSIGCERYGSATGNRTRV
jgi:hypothetical protein